MHYNLTEIFRDINNGKFSNTKIKNKKRLGNFKATWKKRIEKLEEISGKKLIYSKGRGSKAKTICSDKILPYVGIYMNSSKTLKNIDIEHKLMFDEEFIEKYKYANI